MSLTPKRLCIFAHFDASGLVDPHVRFALEQLAAVCDKIVFVTTSGATQAQLDALQLPASQVITRPNSGFDFCSWKAGLDAVAVDEFDELVLCNDSVYGPLFPLRDLFDGMSRQRCDFWGITSGLQYGYHLQSYFLVFKRSVIRSSAFSEFWLAVRPLATKQDVILAYEVRLTRHLIEAGFRPQACFKSRRRDYLKRSFWHLGENGKDLGTLKEALRIYRRGPQLNKTLYFWNEMIDRKVPFVKIELLRTEHHRQELKKVMSQVERSSKYPVSLILDHQRRIGGALARYF
jgi:lipopolysaccharide biosynthesis protein